MGVDERRVAAIIKENEEVWTESQDEGSSESLPDPVETKLCSSDEEVIVGYRPNPSISV